MIQELIERAGQYYTGFINLPIEGQVIGGIGLVVVMAAMKTLWGMLYPVRWTAASLLRIAAFLVHPRKRGPKKASSKRAVDVPFDVSTKKRFAATVKCYKGKKSRYLSDAQLDLLIKTAGIYGYYTSTESHLMGYIVTEQHRRRNEEKAQQQAKEAADLQNKVAEVEPEKVTFVASEVDVV